jgi:hypothetical protein
MFQTNQQLKMQYKPQQNTKKNPFAPDASLQYMDREQVSQKNVDAVMQCFAK